jgi:hypothetical protein
MIGVKFIERELGSAITAIDLRIVENVGRNFNVCAPAKRARLQLNVFTTAQGVGSLA